MTYAIDPAVAQTDQKLHSQHLKHFTKYNTMDEYLIHYPTLSSRWVIFPRPDFNAGFEITDNYSPLFQPI